MNKALSAVANLNITIKSFFVYIYGFYLALVVLGFDNFAHKYVNKLNFMLAMLSGSDANNYYSCASLLTTCDTL